MHTRTFRLSLILFLFALIVRANADPASELASFSVFKNVDLAKLAKGEVMAARGPAMNFPRGLSVETCYIVFAPVQKTAELHRQWNPTRHSELKVYLHVDLPSKPSPADFKKIESAPDNSAVRSLVAATQKLNPDKPELYVSSEEAGSFSKAAGSSNGAVLSAVWSNLLYQRAAAFESGGTAKEPPCNVRGEPVRASDEIARLLKEAGKICAQFPALVDALNGTPSKASPYWELFDVEGQAAFSLGAFIDKSAGDKWQAVDVQYYSSGGYCAMLTFYEGWPVTINGRQATLVWRGDLLSAPALAGLHGIERMGSSTAMMKEIQKGVRAFLKDAGR